MDETVSASVGFVCRECMVVQFFFFFVLFWVGIAWFDSDDGDGMITYLSVPVSVGKQKFVLYVFAQEADVALQTENVHTLSIKWPDLVKQY